MILSVTHNYTASNDWITVNKKFGKKVERRNSAIFWGTIMAFSWNDWGNPSTRIVSFLQKYKLGTFWKCYMFTRLLSRNRRCNHAAIFWNLRPLQPLHYHHRALKLITCKSWRQRLSGAHLLHPSSLSPGNNSLDWRQIKYYFHVILLLFTCWCAQYVTLLVLFLCILFFIWV